MSMTTAVQKETRDVVSTADESRRCYLADKISCWSDQLRHCQVDISRQRMSPILRIRRLRCRRRQVLSPTLRSSSLQGRRK